MIDKYLNTSNGNVYYQVSDNRDNGKETIFFFHGLTADHTMFESQCLYFQGKYNVIAWDAPCHGKSRPYNMLSLEDSSEVILQMLKENQIDRIIAVGQSLGGYYIQAFIARHPEKVSAFIGIGTTPYGNGYYSKSDIFWLKQIGWMGMCYPLNPLKKSSSKQATTTIAGYENMMAMIAPYGKREYCDLMQRAYAAFLRDNFDLEITCPVLITSGEFDKVGKVKTYCKLWHEKTGYPWIVIKGAGHNANVDKPTQMNRVIEEFLASHDL